MSISTQNIKTDVQALWPGLLMILTLILFISKSLYNYPLGLMAVLGLYRCVTRYSTIISHTPSKWFGLLFLCLWLPQVFSLADAVNIDESLRVCVSYLRFLFAGLFILYESRNRKLFEFIQKWTFIIVAFWCVDASIQYFFKTNLFGFPYERGQITGMFYPRNVISHVCAVLSLLYFDYIWRNYYRFPWLWLLLLPLFFIELLSGRRAAWLMLIVSSVVYVLFLIWHSDHRKKLLKRLVFLSCCLAITLFTAYQFNPSVQNRINTTLGLFSTDYETIDRATAWRLSLWETGIEIYKANWINGIGPRGYRFVYQDYALPGSFWQGQTHPHSLTIEILCETGSLGFIGYLVFILLLIKFYLRLDNRHIHFPFFMAIFVAAFPLNALMAFYGSIWSSMLWWIIILAFINVAEQHTFSPTVSIK